MTTKHIQKLLDYELRNKTMAKLRERGWTLERIAIQHGVSIARVSQILSNLPRQETKS